MGELTPGTPLRLEDLARQLGMSISPIREAVRQLEALGLAEHVPHHGAKVMRLDVEELRELFCDPARSREHGRAARRGAVHGRGRGRGARASDRVRRGAPARRHPRRPCGAHGRSTSRSTRRRVVVAPAPDPPGVGHVRALPPRAAREGRAAGPARGARRRAARRRARRTTRPGAAQRCTTTSSSRRTSTPSSSQGRSHLRVLTLDCRSSAAERVTSARAAMGGGFSSSCATSVPEPAPRPGPGQVLAPMCQSRSTGVAWPGLRGNGRQRKFWSSESAPPYGIAVAQVDVQPLEVGGRERRRAGATLDSRFGMCRASRAWIRSA